MIRHQHRSNKVEEAQTASSSYPSYLLHLFDSRDTGLAVGLRALVHHQHLVELLSNLLVQIGLRYFHEIVLMLLYLEIH